MLQMDISAANAKQAYAAEQMMKIATSEKRQTHSNLDHDSIKKESADSNLHVEIGNKTEQENNVHVGDQRVRIASSVELSDDVQRNIKIHENVEGIDDCKSKIDSAYHGIDSSNICCLKQMILLIGAYVVSI